VPELPSPKLLGHFHGVKAEGWNADGSSSFASAEKQRDEGPLRKASRAGAVQTEMRQLERRIAYRAGDLAVTLFLIPRSRKISLALEPFLLCILSWPNAQLLALLAFSVCVFPYRRNRRIGRRFFAPWIARLLVFRRWHFQTAVFFLSRAHWAGWNRHRLTFFRGYRRQRHSDPLPPPPWRGPGIRLKRR